MLLRDICKEGEEVVLRIKKRRTLQEVEISCVVYRARFNFSGRYPLSNWRRRSRVGRRGRGGSGAAENRLIPDQVCSDCRNFRKGAAGGVRKLSRMICRGAKERYFRSKKPVSTVVKRAIFRKSWTYRNWAGENGTVHIKILYNTCNCYNTVLDFKNKNQGK